MTAKIPGLPISSAELRALFDHLDRDNQEPCTHTFKETTKFLTARSLPVESMLNWLGHNGAGCDCEVIFNTDARWGEQVGRMPPEDEL